MNYKTMDITDIIKWCQANGEVEWLKAISATKTPVKVYPRIKVNGKTQADKTATPKIEMRPITFIEVKRAFCEKFMPEILPVAKPKKETFHSLIAKL